MLHIHANTVVSLITKIRNITHTIDQTRNDISLVASKMGGFFLNENGHNIIRQLELIQHDLTRDHEALNKIENDLIEYDKRFEEIEREIASQFRK